MRWHSTAFALPLCFGCTALSSRIHHNAVTWQFPIFCARVNSQRLQREKET